MPKFTKKERIFSGPEAASWLVICSFGPFSTFPHQVLCGALVLMGTDGAGLRRTPSVESQGDKAMGNDIPYQEVREGTGEVTGRS